MDLLALILLLLWLASSLLQSSACELGVGAAMTGFMLILLAQLGAFWALRRHLAPAVVRVIATPRLSQATVLWSAVCAVGLLGINLAALAWPDDFWQAIRLGPIVSHWQGFVAISILVPVIVSAAVFGLVYMNLRVGAFAFAAGLLLGWACLRTGSLWPGVVGHAVNDTVASALFVVADTGPDTPAEVVAQMNCAKQVLP